MTSNKTQNSGGLSSTSNTTGQYQLFTSGEIQLSSSTIQEDLNEEEYYRNLRERQRLHLESVKRRQNGPFRPCTHDSCQLCHGTGIKCDGSACIHFIHCSCPKCCPQVGYTYTGTISDLQVIM